MKDLFRGDEGRQGERRHRPYRQVRKRRRGTDRRAVPAGRHRRHRDRPQTGRSGQESRSVWMVSRSPSMSGSTTRAACSRTCPTLRWCSGYLNASWTLAGRHKFRLCLPRSRASCARPGDDHRHAGSDPPEGEARIVEDDVFDFSSGYIQRGKHINAAQFGVLSVAAQSGICDRPQGRLKDVFRSPDGILTRSPAPAPMRRPPESNSKAAE